MKKLLSWFASLICAICIVNILVFPYERAVAWYDTPHGASIAIHRPGSILIHGTEGYGIVRFDENGYTNSTRSSDDPYILMMGSSHSQGKEIPASAKYSELVNKRLQLNRSKLQAYNIACDGNFLPSLIQHFPSAVANFPDSVCITIEIGSTEYSAEALMDAYQEAGDIDVFGASEIFSQLGFLGKCKNLIKEYCPLISVLKTQKEALSENSGNRKTDNNQTFDYNEYESALRTCLALIREKYDKPIVFVYHPKVEINKSGKLDIIQEKTLSKFMQVCADVGIDFIDLSDDFLKQYEKNYVLPYGFANTTPAKGHMNQIGHSIVADAIWNYYEEEIKH